MTESIYQSQGIAECTGIKSMDYADADKRARDNLTRMISVKVENEVMSIEKDYGAEGSSRSGKISSRQVSEALLKNSSIFSYWLDRESCSLYAGVRVTKADIDQAIKAAKLSEEQKLVHQHWRIKSSGTYAGVILGRLGQTLSSLGVILNKEAGGLVMSGDITEVALSNDNQVMHLTLSLEARNSSGSVIWSRLISGKGVTFNHEAKNVLASKAVQDALENSTEDLKLFLNGAVTP